MEENITVYGFSMSIKDMRFLTVVKGKEFKETVNKYHAVNVIGDTKLALFCFLTEEDAQGCYEAFAPYCKKIKREETNDFTPSEYDKYILGGKKASSKKKNFVKMAKSFMNGAKQDALEADDIIDAPEASVVSQKPDLYEEALKEIGDYTMYTDEPLFEEKQEEQPENVVVIVNEPPVAYADQFLNDNDETQEKLDDIDATVIEAEPDITDISDQNAETDTEYIPINETAEEETALESQDETDAEESAPEDCETAPEDKNPIEENIEKSPDIISSSEEEQPLE